MDIPFQNRLALIALGGGLPATAIAAWFAWTQAPTRELRVVFVLLLVGVWIGCAVLVRRRLVFPLQTLANLVEAIRSGDYTLRGRHVMLGDTLGDVVREVNELGVTLQRQRLESLEASALVQTVLEELDTAVFTFDAAGRLKLLNRSASELIGRSSESLLGRTAHELGLDGLLERDSPAVAPLAFGGRTGRFEVRKRTFREGGKPHTLVMVSDLSRALREEERRAWQRLIRVIGHEINNSLTPIKSLAGTLRDMLSKPQREARHLLDATANVLHATPVPGSSAEPGANGGDVLESLSLIGDRADSLSRFVATYSQLARLPSPAMRRISLNALLHRLVALQPFRGMALEAPFETEVSADAGQLEQAFLNLLKNAVEATRGDASAVDVVVSRTREAVKVEVRDTGPGIANPDNLFVPFFTTKPGGSGIGLALSRQIVEAHGGTLTLESRPGRNGSVARMLLPVPPA